MNIEAASGMSGSGLALLSSTGAMCLSAQARRQSGYRS
jgi:hypothetical protein